MTLWNILVGISCQELASWIFGGLAFLFLLMLIVLPLRKFPLWKVKTLAIITALTSGLFVSFLTGSIVLSVEPEFNTWGKTAIQAGGGIALFVFVLLWWRPVLKQKTSDDSQASNGTGKEMVTVVVRLDIIIGVTLGIFLVSAIAYVYVYYIGFFETYELKIAQIAKICTSASFLGLLLLVVIYFCSSKYKSHHNSHVQRETHNLQEVPNISLEQDREEFTIHFESDTYLIEQTSVNTFKVKDWSKNCPLPKPVFTILPDKSVSPKPRNTNYPKAIDAIFKALKQRENKKGERQP